MKKAGSIFSFVLVLAIYHISSIIKNSPTLPKLGALYDSAVNILSDKAFSDNLLYTLRIVLVGITISFIIGNAIAIICTACDKIKAIIMPIINAIKNIPSIALFPVFIILLGINDASRVAVIIWNSLYPIIATTITGIESIDDEISEAGSNCGADKFQMYRYIKIPLAVPSMLEGLKNIELLEPVVTIKSALNADSEAQLDALCKALIK